MVTWQFWCEPNPWCAGMNAHIVSWRVGVAWGSVGWLVVLVKKGSGRWGPVLSWRHFLSLWLFPNSYPFITRSIL